jgi:hypothetical protein
MDEDVDFTDRHPDIDHLGLAGLHDKGFREITFLRQNSATPPAGDREPR